MHNIKQPKKQSDKKPKRKVISKNNRRFVTCDGVKYDITQMIGDDYKAKSIYPNCIISNKDLQYWGEEEIQTIITM